MFSSFLQHSEHLAAWLSSDLQLLSLFFSFTDRAFFIVIAILRAYQQVEGRDVHPLSLKPAVDQQGTFLSYSSSFACCYSWELVTPIHTLPSPPEQPDSAWNLWLIWAPPGGITPDTDTLMKFPPASAPKRLGHPIRVLWEICLRGQKEVKKCLSVNVLQTDFGKAFIYFFNIKSYQPQHLVAVQYNDIAILPHDIVTCWTRGVCWHYNHTLKWFIALMLLLRSSSSKIYITVQNDRSAACAWSAALWVWCGPTQR